jgi:hypothetical protein
MKFDPAEYSLEKVDRIKKLIKKGQATHIAPLQPPTLATFRSWGDSAGAGRMRLAQLQK